MGKWAVEQMLRYHGIRDDDTDWGVKRWLERKEGGSDGLRASVAMCLFLLFCFIYCSASVLHWFFVRYSLVIPGGRVKYGGRHLENGSVGVRVGRFLAKKTPKPLSTDSS